MWLLYHFHGTYLMVYNVRLRVHSVSTMKAAMTIKAATCSLCSLHARTEIDDTTLVLDELVFVCYIRGVQLPHYTPSTSLYNTLLEHLLISDLLPLRHYSSLSGKTCVPGHPAPKLLMIFHHCKKKRERNGWLIFQYVMNCRSGSSRICISPSSSCYMYIHFLIKAASYESPIQHGIWKNGRKIRRYMSSCVLLILTFFKLRLESEAVWDGDI